MPVMAVDVASQRHFCCCRARGARLICRHPHGHRHSERVGGRFGGFVGIFAG